MKLAYIATAAACALLVAGAASAQQRVGSDFPGTNPAGFRDANDRLVRLQGALAIEQRRDGYMPGGVGFGSGVGGGLGSSQAANNMTTIVNQVSCTASAGAVVTCTGGTAANSGAQSSTGNTNNATTTVRDNTVTNSATTNNNPTTLSAGDR